MRRLFETVPYGCTGSLRRTRSLLCFGSLSSSRPREYIHDCVSKKRPDDLVMARRAKRHRVASEIGGLLSWLLWGRRAPG
jgi:hypothetical protein